MSYVLDAICKRRSIRSYTGEAIPQDKLDAILAAGLLSPTSQNRRPWQFYVTTDNAMLAELSRAKRAGAAFVAHAPVAVVVAVDGEDIDTWVEDESIALAYMHLVASDLGIGSCWVQMHLRSAQDGTDAEDKVRQALELDPRQRIVGVLALGVPAQNPTAHSVKDADFDRVHYR